MYKTKEIFKKDGICLKEVLKHSITSYYKKSKTSDNTLHISDVNANIRNIKLDVLSKVKEETNAY